MEVEAQARVNKRMGKLITMLLMENHQKEVTIKILRVRPNQSRSN